MFFFYSGILYIFWSAVDLVSRWWRHHSRAPFVLFFWGKLHAIK